MSTETKAPESEADREYRQKSTRHMFRQQLFGALGGAAFLGVLGSIAGMVIQSFSTTAAAGAGASAAAGAGGVAAAGAAAAGFLGVTPVGWLVIGGLMAAGVASTYLSQVEATKLREVQDDRLAQKNAQELCKNQSMGHAQGVEQNVLHEQNCRADGKSWQQAVSQPSAGHSLAV